MFFLLYNLKTALHYNILHHDTRTILRHSMKCGIQGHTVTVPMKIVIAVFVHDNLCVQ